MDNSFTYVRRIIPSSESGFLLPVSFNIPTAGLLGQWIMDNAHVSGATILDSIGTNNGTAVGAGVTSAAGPRGHTARAYDGINNPSNSFIQLASNPLATWNAGAYTVAGWIYVDNNSVAGGNATRQTFFNSDLTGDGATNILRIISDTAIGAGAITVGMNAAVNPTGSISTDTTALPSATWVSLVFTFNAGTSVLYINGGAITPTAHGGLVTDGTTVTTFGSEGPTVGDGSIQGRTYNWLIYNRAITAVEALQIYNAG